MAAGARTSRAPVILTGAAAALTLSLTVTGFWIHDRPQGPADIANMAFDATAMLFFNRPDGAPENAWFVAAQIGAVVFVILGAFTTILLLSRVARAWWIGLVSRLRPRRAHSVVLGLSDVGAQLSRDIRTGGGERPVRSVIGVEEERDSPAVERMRRHGALLFHEDARNRGIRRRARLHVAQEVFVTSADDTWNLDVALGIAADVQQGSRARPPLRWPWSAGASPLRCYVHVGEPDLASAVREQERLYDNDLPVDVEIFSVRENAARELLLGDRDRGLARRSFAPRSDEVAHYFLYGFGPTGQTVALQMARLAHFANLRRLRLTVFEELGGPAAANRLLRRFVDRHPGFCPDPGFGDQPPFRLDERVEAHGPALDRWDFRGARPAAAAWRFDEPPDVVEYAVNAEFRHLPTVVDAPQLIQELRDRLAPSAGPPVRAGVVVCFEEEHRNFHAALRLRTALHRLRLEDVVADAVPVFAYLPTDEGLGEMLETVSASGREGPVQPFGRVRRCGGYETVVQPGLHERAAAFHEAWQRLADGSGPTDVGASSMPLPQDALFDDSDRSALMRRYRDLPPALRRSNEEAAAHAVIKLDTVGYEARSYEPPRRGAAAVPPAVEFEEEEVELLARMEHNRWMAERLVAGWRYGDRRDETKRRPAFRPWASLAEDPGEQAKDLDQILTLVRAYNLAGQALLPLSGEKQPGKARGRAERPSAEVPA